MLRLHLRQAGVTEVRAVEPERVALILCDLWDTHWCTTLAAGTVRLAEQVDRVAADARRLGVVIIHAPSDCMRAYEGTAGRERAVAVGRDAQTEDVAGPVLPPFPVREGCPCPTPCSAPQPSEEMPWPWPWRSQHPTIGIHEADYVSDEQGEVLGIVRTHETEFVLLCGVHTDACVVDRPFGLRALVAAGIEAGLIRDLTEASRPAFTEAAVEHIERYLAPTIVSADITFERA